jgi:hypothetical protein
MVTITKPGDIDWQVLDYFKRASALYEKVFIKDGEPWNEEAVIGIAKLIQAETERVTMLVQLETLLARKVK